MIFLERCFKTWMKYTSLHAKTNFYKIMLIKNKIKEVMNLDSGKVNLEDYTSKKSIIDDLSISSEDSEEQKL